MRKLQLFLRSRFVSTSLPVLPVAPSSAMFVSPTEISAMVDSIRNATGSWLAIFTSAEKSSPSQPYRSSVGHCHTLSFPTKPKSSLDGSCVRANVLVPIASAMIWNLGRCKSARSCYLRMHGMRQFCCIIDQITTGAILRPHSRDVRG